MAQKRFRAPKPINEMRGEDEEETRLLSAQLSAAREYLRTHDWCKSIKKEYFGDGVGGIVAAFLFHITPRTKDVDDKLWVVCGDIPSAYLVLDDAPTGTDAISIYCDLMTEWAEAVLSEKGLDDVYPVDAKPTKKNAKDLLSRIEFIRQEIVGK